MKDFKKIWRDKNKEYVRKYNAKWQKEHSEYMRKRNSEYRKANSDKIAVKNRKYYRDHPEVFKAKDARRRACKSASGGSFTGDEFMSLCLTYGNLCLCCKKIKPLTADHVIPILLGGTSNIDNIQPLCGPCNSRKGTKVIDFRTNFGLNTTQVHMEHETPKTLSMYVGRGKK